jgi:hypothetical protein
MANENESEFFALFNKLFLAGAGIIFFVVVCFALYFVLISAFNSKNKEKQPENRSQQIELPASNAGNSEQTQTHLLYSKTDVKIKRESGLASFTVNTLKDIKGFSSSGIPYITDSKNWNKADVVMSAKGKYNGENAIADLLFKNEGTANAAHWLVGVYIWKIPEGNLEREQWLKM